ncbi:MAG: DNA repair protein RadA [Clostridia bacterium]|nr:DNA repair protein RadA [Clostridia bacterium]
MAKVKTCFFCNECGYESSGWLGKCPGCGAWNTFVEEKIHPETKGGNSFGFAGISSGHTNATPIGDIPLDQRQRTASGIGELDRVLGGGIVPGSLILVAGDPGIGKSTMMLMLSGHLAKTRKVLYVSGEESGSQIKLRAQRLSVCEDQLYIYAETSMDAVIAQIETLKPDVVIIDSVQTLADSSVSSAPGSVSQVREITGTFLRLSKSLNITVFIVGHVTKEGAIAGPRVLEHMVDTVLYFEGERHLSYRILRAVKNRFGSTNEIGVFEMRETGLWEVENPSMALLEGRPTQNAGTAVVCAMEGTRPVMLEVQALISGSNLSNPRRMSTGLDYNRFALLLAVLEKRGGYRLAACDAYVNVIGGIRLLEPASDLAVAAAVMSSYRNVVLPEDTVFIGEVGLTGEIRAVSHIDKRINESLRLGFKRCIVPKGNQKQVEQTANVVFVENIHELSDFIGKGD